MSLMKVLAVIYLVAYSFVTYVLTQKGWLLYQAVVGSFVLTTIWGAMAALPVAIFAFIYRLTRRVDEMKHPGKSKK